MDIIVSEKSLRYFLKTEAKIDKIIELLCNSGPTVDRFHKKAGDTVMEIEIITNRIDSASVFGVAREANAILNQNKIKSKLVNNPYLINQNNHQTQTENLNFQLLNKDLVRRFTSVSIDDVSIKPSPKDICELLETSGQRPINNIVDITNATTLEYGIPSHVFDKDKLGLQKLTIRESKQGERITTLDNTKLVLNAGDIVIEDGTGKLVDLCDIMGGQAAVVDEHTKNIVLIVPMCDPQKIRKTSIAHQKRTLAAQINEKGPDPELCLPILNILTEKIIKTAGGKISSKVFDLNNTTQSTKTIELKLAWLNTFSGIKIGKAEVVSILKNLGFLNIKINDKTILVDVPSFRLLDINNREDMAEEVVRVFGYYKIPATLPALNKTPKPTSSIFTLERRIKSILTDEGFNEVYNNSLISKPLIESCGLKLNEHLKLKNCLSEDLEYLRTTLVPSALQNHSNNKGRSKQTLNFFEIANVYIPDNNAGLPAEISTLIISSDIDLLKLKLVLEKLFNLLNYKNYDFLQPSNSKIEYLNTQNSADIIINSKTLGYMGQIKSLVSKKFNVTNTISIVEINISSLNDTIPNLQFTPVSEYPSLKDDITITSTKPIGEIIKSLKSISKNIKEVGFIGSYENKHTFEVTIGSDTQNLTKSDADVIKNKILLSFPT